MKNKGLIIIIFALIFSVGCLKEPVADKESFDKVSKSKPDSEFAKGELLVGFFQEATEEEVTALAEKHGLSWESYFPKMFSAWITVPSLNSLSQEEKYQPLLVIAEEIEEKDEGDKKIVMWADARDGKILIQFNILATEQSAREFIDSFEGLEFEEFNKLEKMGVFFVPEGKESSWKETLEKEEMVRYVNYNYYVELF